MPMTSTNAALSHRSSRLTKLAERPGWSSVKPVHFFSSSFASNAAQNASSNRSSGRFPGIMFVLTPGGIFHVLMSDLLTRAQVVVHLPELSFDAFVKGIVVHAEEILFSIETVVINFLDADLL